MTVRMTSLIPTLLLVAGIAYEIGARTAAADFDGNLPRIVGLGSSSDTNDLIYVMRNDGTVFQWAPTDPVWRLAVMNPPVPLSEVVLWDKRGLVTRSGDVWMMDFAHQWHQTAPIPDAVVHASSSPWGEIKQRFRQ